MNQIARLHPDFTYRIDYVGNENQPVLIIDNFVDHPELLIDLADGSGEYVHNSNFYPGVRVQAPPVYIELMFKFLGKLLLDIFFEGAQKKVDPFAFFSIVTTPPDKLHPLQCIPHFDSMNPWDLAGVHYLCAGDKGGTSLYRHRKTGYERLNEARKETYFRAINEEINPVTLERRYMHGSNDYFEQIASYEAVFNRLIMYRSTNLHSGNISRDFTFDSHPRTGRLTLNTFIRSSE